MKSGCFSLPVRTCVLSEEAVEEDSVDAEVADVPVADVPEELDSEPVVSVVCVVPVVCDAVVVCSGSEPHAVIRTVSAIMEAASNAVKIFFIKVPLSVFCFLIFL